jgi:hypothetical protein
LTRLRSLANNAVVELTNPTDSVSDIFPDLVVDYLHILVQLEATGEWFYFLICHHPYSNDFQEHWQLSLGALTIRYKSLRAFITPYGVNPLMIFFVKLPPT